MEFIISQNNKQLSVCSKNHVTHHLRMLATHLILFLFLADKVRDSKLSGVVSARRCAILPRVAGKFCLCAGNGASKRAAGTMERAEARPITGDEFCALGNLLKTQNCQSAAHISMRLMTHGFSFTHTSELVACCDCWTSWSHFHKCK